MPDRELASPDSDIQWYLDHICKPEAHRHGMGEELTECMKARWGALLSRASHPNTSSPVLG